VAPSQLQAEIERIAVSLSGAHPKRSAFSTRRLEDAAMAFVGQRPEIQAALFRVVDVAPVCRSHADVGAHLVALLPYDDASRLLDQVVQIGRGQLGRNVLGRVASLIVRRMARRFIIAERPDLATRALSGLWHGGVAHSLDLLGEMTVMSAEADRYAVRCLGAIETLSRLVRTWQPQALLERDSAGIIPRANLSVKVSALTGLQRAEAPTRIAEDVRPRLQRLLRAARERDVHVHIDMESLDWREGILRVVLDLLSETEFRSGPSIGLVLQAYLTDSSDQLDQLLKWQDVVARRQPLTIRLVKGAYWDHEVIDAQLNGWTVPVWNEKRATDRQFELLTRRLIDASPMIRLAIGSHNLRSVAHALAYARAVGVKASDVEFQVLRGLGDDLQAALQHSGLRVRTYCPIGDLIAGMAYLVRRLLENSSNDSFLVKRAQGTDLRELLVSP
jgi:RHH-type proline utilization regulon transcriptional repressor/proline dehydrogenase/delta 1-pyrroline-5-carboxylate dehydrogenase